MIRERYYPGFDYLRAFFCIAIVGWHTKAFGYAHIMDKTIESFRITIPDIIYANCFLVGVPLFFQISLFLFVQNRCKTKDYLLHRLKRLGFIYLFWGLVSSIFLYDGIELTKLKSLDYWIAAGYTHIYFIFSLIVITIGIELLCVLQSKMRESIFKVLNISLLIISVSLLLFRIPLYELVSTSHYAYLLVEFYSPLNFVPYIFTTFIICSYYRKIKPLHLLLLGLISLIVITLEWKCQVNTFNLAHGGILISPYARVSLIITASLVMCLALQITQDAPKLIMQVSKLSLGIYITHYYFANKFARIFPDIAEKILSNNLLTFIFVLILSVGLSYIIKYKKII